MANSLCRLLETTPSGTAIREIMMNGEDVSRAEIFIRYDKKTGLAYFTNSENSFFVALADKIDMIEFAPLEASAGASTELQAQEGYEWKPQRPQRNLCWE